MDTTSDLAGKLREKHPRRDQLSGSCVHLQSERLQCVRAQYRLAVLLAEDTDYGALRIADLDTNLREGPLLAVPGR